MAGSAEEFPDRNTCLQSELISVDRGESFAAEVLACDDQRIDIIRAQLNFRCLSCACFLFEILPAFVHALNLLIRTAEFRNGRWRFCNRMCFGKPVVAIEQRRVTVKPPLYFERYSDH